MIFQNAWLLLLLFFVPLLWWRWNRRTFKTGISYCSAIDISLLPTSFRSKTLWVPALLRIIAIIVLIVCVARPQKRFEKTKQAADGVAIEMVIDRSSSMNAHDFTIDGKAVDRLTAVRKVAGDFISGMGSLDGRSSDLIGLVTFAGYADSNCPMTFDHEFLVTDVLDSIRIVNERTEDGTAIGDALALAVERLASLDERVKSESGNTIQSKVIILLTDGENNQGDITPRTAADMAAAMGITVYTIGIGSGGSSMFRALSGGVDDGSLQAIAEVTGGKYFRATDLNALKEVYTTIDELEPSPAEVRQLVTHVELFRRFAVPGLLLLLLQFLLSATVLRRGP